MKKVFILFVFAAIFYSCAPGPIGSWNYSVTGTPQGDYKGVMTIMKTDKGYAAKLVGDTGEVPFNTFSYASKTKTATGTFDFSGVNLDFNSKVDKDAMKGSLSTSGMEFPFVATRKK
ncbi:MAG: hypothetical protein HOP08_07620 [Cyclobacteriaceae bacterium]|nr:hypothetical protein [Cyclobacteriaceae bacterium]